MARTIEEGEGWNVPTKLRVMETIMRDKFRRSRDLRDRLAATQNRELVNVGERKDEESLFWGVVGTGGRGQGQNQLGKVLEKVRQSVHDESEIVDWIGMAFKLVEGRKKLPIINLECYKDGELIETITLDGKAFYIFGAHQLKCDVLLRHQSISRVHAALLIDQDLGVVLLDLMSKAGTKLDDQQIDGCIPMPVKPGQKMVFGLSTRTYQVQIDYSKMQRAVEMEKRNLEREMRMLEKLDDVGNLDMATLKSTLGLVKEDTLYVSNLPYSCTEEDLGKLFGDCGKILSIRMPENRQTKQNRGFAFITMENEKGARKALNYDGHKIHGRKLRVSKAEKKMEIEEKRMKVEEKDDKNDKRRRRSRSRSYDKRKTHQHKRRRSYSRSPSSSSS